MSLGDLVLRFSPEMRAASKAFGIHPDAVLAPNKYKNEQRISSLKGDVEESLASQKEYQTPEEALRLQELASQSAERLRGMSDIGQKAVDIAEFQAGLSQAPGATQAREDISGSTAQAIQSIIQAGGSNAAALGAISDVNRNQMEQLRQVAAQGEQYQSQARRDLQSALMGQASLEAGLEGQALGAETLGLQTMIGERGKEYESYLDKLRTQQQFQLTELGNAYASEDARKNRNTQLWGSILGGLTGLGSSLATGGLTGVGSAVQGVGGTAAGLAG